jgi:hypothetical protein
MMHLKMPGDKYGWFQLVFEKEDEMKRFIALTADPNWAAFEQMLYRRIENARNITASPSCPPDVLVEQQWRAQIYYELLQLPEKTRERLRKHAMGQDAEEE